MSSLRLEISHQIRVKSGPFYDDFVNAFKSGASSSELSVPSGVDQVKSLFAADLSSLQEKYAADLQATVSQAAYSVSQLKVSVEESRTRAAEQWLSDWSGAMSLASSQLAEESSSARALKTKGEKIAKEATTKVIEILQSHLEQTKKMAEHGAKVTDADLAALGPKLVAMTTGYAKAGKERDALVDAAEAAFKTTVEELRGMHKSELERARDKAEKNVAGAMELLKEERERCEARAKEEVDKVKVLCDRLKDAMDKKMAAVDASEKERDAGYKAEREINSEAEKSHKKQLEDLKLMHEGQIAALKAPAKSKADADAALLKSERETFEAYKAATASNHAAEIDELNASFELRLKSTEDSGTLQQARNLLKQERESAAKSAASLQASHARQLEELQGSFAVQLSAVGAAFNAREEEGALKQASILAQLTKTVTEETESFMQRRLESLERAAKDRIVRSRVEFDNAKAAEEAATAKFTSLVDGMRSKWEKEESVRISQIESRIKAQFESEIVSLQQQIEAKDKFFADSQDKWQKILNGQLSSHASSIKHFAEKCRATYDERLAAIVRRAEEEFLSYEQKLLSADRDLTEQTMQFENRLQGIKVACNEWKDEHRRALDESHLEAVNSLETRYTAEIEKLQNQLGEAQKFIADTKRITPESSRVRMDGLLSSFIKLRKALELAPNEQIAMLMKLLQNADFSPRVLKCYSALEGKLSDQLPLKKMATRREFIKYRLLVISRFGDNPSTNPNTNGDAFLTTDLEDELEALNVMMRKSIARYENQHGVPFVFEGNIYREQLELEELKEITEHDL